MRRLKNALPVLLTMAIALSSAVSGGYDYAADNIFIQSVDESSEVFEENSSVEEENNSVTDSSTVQSTEDSRAENTESVSAVSSQSSSSVPASSAGTAVGKVSERFISPYSAKLSYNNVYVKNNSGLSIDLKAELAEPLKIKLSKSAEPQVLILHTHGTECFMYEDRDYYTASDATRTTDNTKNIIHIGEIVANKLKNANIGVIHDKTQHDNPSYNQSYSRAAVTIKEYLKKYPSIKIVLDIHRDSIALNDTDRVRPVAEIDGKDAAQVMLCMGSESGNIKNFPNWKENFRLAARFHQTLEVMYPGLARPMVLASKRYNENLTTGSMLLEVGTESNLLSEAEYSAELVGNALVSLLNTLA